MGLFASPNRAAVMNSLPPGDRGAGGGMNQTFQNSAQVLSIGVFFTLMIIGLSSKLPSTMLAGLQAHGVPFATANAAAHLPPVSILFAAFLGYNPIEHLLGPHALAALSAHDHATLVGRSFFPHLISEPFRSGLREAFAFSIVACLIAAAASLMRGGRYHAHNLTASPQTSDGRAGASRPRATPARASVETGGPAGEQQVASHLVGPALHAINTEEQHAPSSSARPASSVCPARPSTPSSSRRTRERWWSSRRRRRADARARRFERAD